MSEKDVTPAITRAITDYGEWRTATSREALEIAILAYGNALYLQGMHDRAKSPYVSAPEAIDYDGLPV